MSFTVVDWIIGGVIVIFALSGLAKGFVNNVFGKLALILAIVGACFFYDNAAQMIFSGIQNEVLRKVLGFLIVFVVVFLIVKAVQVVISKIFQLHILRSLDKTLGFFFGILEGLIFIGLIIFLLSVQPFFSVEGLFEDSFFYAFINSILLQSKEISLNV